MIDGLDKIELRTTLSLMGEYCYKVGHTWDDYGELDIS